MIFLSTDSEKKANTPFKGTMEMIGADKNKKPGFIKRSFMTGILGLGLLFNMAVNYACNGVSNNNPSDTTPYATVLPEDVFTGNGLSGRVVVNGTEGQSGDRFRIDGNVVNSIEIEVAGYKSSYILAVENGDTIVYARDKNGTFKTYAINSDRTIHARIVPNDFDTVTLAKSIGNWVNPIDDTLGDGTVIRYDKRSIDVCIVEDGVAAGGAEQNVKNAINTIDNGNSIITLNYVGKQSSALSNGVTYVIRNNISPFHTETINNNIIIKSGLGTMPGASFNAILGELIQAAAGLRADGGTDHCVYVESSGLVNDASRAIYLVNFSPIGFQYDPNSGDPAASQALMVVKTIADQQEEDMYGERSFTNPMGSYIIPEHRGPGRYSSDKGPD